jgi:hypothetical protein
MVPAIEAKNLGNSITSEVFVMNKLGLMVSLAAAVFTLQPVAHAGAVANYGVSVSTYGAYGNLHDARNSGDNKQFIGCAVYGTTQSVYTTYVACSAGDAAGHTFYCATYGASYVLVQAALAVSQSSAVIINSDSQYHCTYIYVSNNSTNL